MRFRLIDKYVISFHRKGYLMLCFNQVSYIKIKTDIKQVIIIIYFQAKNYLCKIEKIMNNNKKSLYDPFVKH